MYKRQIFGNIAVDNSKRNEDGRARKYNAAFAAQHGKLLTNGTLPYDFIVKNALPNYREFDDNRHFYGLRQLALELDKQVAGLHQPLTVTAHGETVKLGLMPVSYTHLDVYKRQTLPWPRAASDQPPDDDRQTAAAIRCTRSKHCTDPGLGYCGSCL